LEILLSLIFKAHREQHSEELGYTHWEKLGGEENLKVLWQRGFVRRG
jgi:hypothetical protein